MLQNMLLIGAGGFLGSVMRYGSGQMMLKVFDSSHPIGTFFVNIAGSFLIGLILGMSEKGAVISMNWKLFLAVGFCGGFTTFSAFALENMNFLQSQQFMLSFLYVGLSLFLGLAAVYFGFWLAK
ncbi:MAG: fluoride efflux transporter CrcB [Bacteroidales bacterium]|nr:fluoride efflux transporter CrcB [Bacteroidales bacterium]